LSGKSLIGTCVFIGISSTPFRPHQATFFGKSPRSSGILSIELATGVSGVYRKPFQIGVQETRMFIGFALAVLLRKPG